MVARAFWACLAIVIGAWRPAVAQPAPPAPPDPAIAVPHHLEAVTSNLAASRATDVVGRRALAEARTSIAAARAALADNALRTADEFAASADDLIAAANGPPRVRGMDPAQILARLDGFTAVLAGVTTPRVQALLAFARGVADEARRKAALGDDDAGLQASRAEAIARAATHVAIAADPSLAPRVPPPKPPPPPANPP